MFLKLPREDGEPEVYVKLDAITSIVRTKEEQVYVYVGAAKLTANIDFDTLINVLERYLGENHASVIDLSEVSDICSLPKEQTVSR